MIVVRIPGLAIAVVDLNKADTPLRQSPRQETAIGEMSRAIQVASRLGFLLQFESFGCRKLHPKGGLHGLQSTFQLIVLTCAIEMQLVQLRHQLDLPHLCRPRGVRVFEKGDQFCRDRVAMVDIGSLMGTR